MGLYPTPANSKLPQSKWRNCQACFWGWGPCMLQGLNHRLGFWNPKCSKSLPLFCPQNWSLGSKGPGILLRHTTKPRHKLCHVAYETKHLKHRFRKASHKQVTTSLVPRSELCNHKKKIPWEKIQELSCWILGLNLHICISIIEHWNEFWSSGINYWT